MDATTARPTLLNAARNFIRKSAGTAVLAIAPLAAVSVAPEAQAQTIFSQPGAAGTLGLSGTEGSFFSGAGTFSSASYLVNGVRVARSINFITNGTSGGFSGGVLTIQLGTFSAVTPVLDSSQSIDFTYDFTLSLSGLSLDYWSLKASFDDGAAGSGFQTLVFDNTGTAGNKTGNGSFFAPLLSNENYSLSLILGVSASSDGQNVLVSMTGGSQGVTLNATPIPEPSTYVAIFGLGALGFVIIRRSRRARAA